MTASLVRTARMDAASGADQLAGEYARIGSSLTAWDADAKALSDAHAEHRRAIDAAMASIVNGETGHG